MVDPGKVKAAPEDVKPNTAVWWDLETCPVPVGYDARRVRPSIESALKNLGYHGPVTITAIGNLEKTPTHVLRALATTGIVAKHIIPNLVRSIILDEISSFKFNNRPPATIMLISDKVESQMMTFCLCRSQQSRSGYDLVVAYSYTSMRLSILYTRAELHWASLLGAEKQDTGRRLVLRKCSESGESGESSSFYCASCNSTGLSRENLKKHLSSEEHKLEEIDIMRCKMRDPGGERPSKTKVSKRLRISPPDESSTSSSSS